MSKKETLLSYFYKAKEDYEASLNASKTKLFPNKHYERLKTEVGLCEYFQRTFDVCNIVDKHLIKYKPTSVLTGYWFPTRTQEGFEGRLHIINNAIDYYNSIEEASIPLILNGDYLDHFPIYTAYEKGFRGDDNMDAIMEYLDENYDDMLNGLEPL